jgi:hypothetical protein
MARPKRATGQITFRCSVELHQELLEIATVLGVDLNAVLNMMLKETLPEYRQRAQEQAHQHLQSSRTFAEEVAIPTEDPVVRQLILAARQAPANRRPEVLQDCAERFSGPTDPPPRETVFFALKLKDKAVALHQLRQLRKPDGHSSLDAGQQEVLRQIEQRIEQDMEKLKHEREKAKQRGSRR